MLTCVLMIHCLVVSPRSSAQVCILVEHSCKPVPSHSNLVHFILCAQIEASLLATCTILRSMEFF